MTPIFCLLLLVRMFLLGFESNTASNKKDGRCQHACHNDLCIGLSACQYMGAKSSVPGEWSSITVYRRTSSLARIHLHWLLGFYSHLFRGSRKMAPTVEAQVPAKTKLPDPHNPTVASNLSLRRGPHLKYGPRDRDPRSTTRQTRASTVTQRFPRPKQIQTIPNFPLIPPHPQPVGPPATKIFTFVANSGS